MIKIIIIFWTILISNLSIAGHSQYNSYNYYGKTRAYFSESAVTEYDTYRINNTNKDCVGAGVKTEVGIETLKVMQFSLFHTFLNTQNGQTAAENLRGFRLGLGLKFAFASPLANLEIGGGGIASQFDYQNDSLVSTYKGVGSYFHVGISYYFYRYVSGIVNIFNIREQLSYNRNTINNIGTSLEFGVRFIIPTAN